MKTRRQFLTSAAALGAVPCVAAAAESVPGAIDAHVHVWTPDISKYPLSPNYKVGDMKPPSFTPEELFAHSKPAGVSRIVLIQMSFYGTDNSYMLDVMKAHPGVFSGVAVIDEKAPEVAETMAELAKSGVRGFRIRSSKANAESWLSSPEMNAMWTAGAAQNLSMCLLADPDSLPAALKMCQKHPATPVVIDHFARIGVSGTIEKADLGNLLKFAELENVCVKTSAFYALGKKKPRYDDLGPMIRELRDAFGADRLMWASDCPYQVVDGHSYAASISLIRDRLDFLSEDERDWMLRGTAERVFF